MSGPLTVRPVGVHSGGSLVWCQPNVPLPVQSATRICENPVSDRADFATFFLRLAAPGQRIFRFPIRPPHMAGCSIEDTGPGLSPASKTREERQHPDHRNLPIPIRHPQPLTLHRLLRTRLPPPQLLVQDRANRTIPVIRTTGKTNRLDDRNGVGLIRRIHAPNTVKLLLALIFQHFSRKYSDFPHVPPKLGTEGPDISFACSTRAMTREEFSREYDPTDSNCP